MLLKRRDSRDYPAAASVHNSIQLVTEELKMAILFNNFYGEADGIFIKWYFINDNTHAKNNFGVS